MANYVLCIIIIIVAREGVAVLSINPQLCMQSQLTVTISDTSMTI